MKKSLMLAAFAAVTAASAAIAQNPLPPDAGMRGRGPGGPGGRGGPGMADRMLLDGITLTDAQQASLKALRDADRDKMEASREADRAEFEAIRDARQKGDSAAVAKLVAAQRAKMDARRDQQIAAIRALLSADQYAAFDANVAELKKRQAEGPRPGGRGRGQRPPQGRLVETEMKRPRRCGAFFFAAYLPRLKA